MLVWSNLSCFAGASVFKYRPPSKISRPHSVYLLPNLYSFLTCDFRGATRLAGLNQGRGNGFSYVLNQVRPNYFASGEGDDCKKGLMKFVAIPLYRPPFPWCVSPKPQSICNMLLKNQIGYASLFGFSCDMYCNKLETVPNKCLWFFLYVSLLQHNYSLLLGTNDSLYLSLSFFLSCVL